MVTANQIAAARRQAATFLDARVTIRRVDPGEVTYVDGQLHTAPGEVIYSGPASISDASARDAQTTITGGETIQENTWQIRAPLQAQTCLPGDEVIVDDPGDFPIPTRRLWVRATKGRHHAVLARLVVTATRPGSVDG